MSEITRIVRMSFQPAACSAFESLFGSVKDAILKMPGCRSLALKKDTTLSNVYYTISTWDTEHDLNAYRQSSFFQETWTKTKLLFDQKPVAYSLTDLPQPPGQSSRS